MSLLPNFVLANLRRGEFKSILTHRDPLHVLTVHLTLFLKDVQDSILPNIKNLLNILFHFTVHGMKVDRYNPTISPKTTYRPTKH